MLLLLLLPPPHTCPVARAGTTHAHVQARLRRARACRAHANGKNAVPSPNAGRRLAAPSALWRNDAGAVAAATRPKNKRRRNRTHDDSPIHMNPRLIQCEPLHRSTAPAVTWPRVSRLLRQQRGPRWQRRRGAAGVLVGRRLPLGAAKVPPGLQGREGVPHAHLCPPALRRHVPVQSELRRP